MLDTVEIESSHGRHVASGTLKLLAAQVLILVVGLVITTFLARQLGPDLYGLYTVAATIVTWVEISMTSVFERITPKFVAEAADWRAVASTLAQAQILVGLGGAALLMIAAPALAFWLRSPKLADYLRLFALGIPLFTLASVFRATLIGRGAFGQGALLTTLHWLCRLALVLLLVGLGLSLTGAILASIGASLIWLIGGHVLLRPALLRRSAFPFRRLAGYALPLFLFAIGMRLFSQLDLLAVKALGATPAAAGYYGATQSLTIVPCILFSASLSQPLLATLPRLLQKGQSEDARAMIGQAMRLVWCLLPFAGLVAGAAPGIIALIYGASFSPAATLLAWLVFAAVAVTLILIATAILTATGRPGWTFALTGPLVPLALVAHLVLVPRFGPVGAAAGTTTLAWLGAGVTAWAVHRHCGVRLSLATGSRILLATAIAYVLASIWSVSGVWVVVELLGIAVVILFCLLLLGELTGQDVAFAWSLLRHGREMPSGPGTSRILPGEAKDV